MNIFKYLTECKDTIKNLRVIVAKRDEQIKAYGNLVYRFLNVSNIPGLSYPFADGNYYTFDSYVAGLEAKVAQDKEREKIRVFVKEILAEDEDKRPN